MFRLFSNLYSPEDSTGTGVITTGPASDNKEDIIEFLGEDDDDKSKEIIDLNKPLKDKSLPKEKEDDEELDKEDKTEEDELAELEDELKEPTEEQLELTTPVRRKEILAKYPNLFKEFPYLEKAYYREQQFTELLPTIDDAKEAVAKARTLDNFEADLVKGNTVTLLKSIKQESPDSFLKIVDEYLPTLAKVDEQAYYHVLGNLTKHTIAAMVQEARKSNNEVLQSAASILNQFVFGSTDYKPPTNLSRTTPEKDKVDTEINERQRAFTKQQFDNVHQELNTKVNNTLKNTIDAHIDPKGSMTDYVKKTASKEVLDSLDGVIMKDARFKALADKLWEKAFESNFSKESTDRIRSAYLSKAKTVLPALIKKARNEALRGTGHRVRDDDESTPNKGPIVSGKPRSQQPTGGKITSPKDIPKNMSTLDFLNS